MVILDFFDHLKIISLRAIKRCKRCISWEKRYAKGMASAKATAKVYGRFQKRKSKGIKAKMVLEAEEAIFQGHRKRIYFLFFTSGSKEKSSFRQENLVNPIFFQSGKLFS